jgi:hypothetical protein
LNRDNDLSLCVCVCIPRTRDQFRDIQNVTNFPTIPRFLFFYISFDTERRVLSDEKHIKSLLSAYPTCFKATTSFEVSSCWKEREISLSSFSSSSFRTPTYLDDFTRVTDSGEKKSFISFHF